MYFPFHSSLTCRVSFGRSAMTFIYVFLYMLFPFLKSLVLPDSCLYLRFAILITSMSWSFSIWDYHQWNSLGHLDMSNYIPQFGKLLSLISNLLVLHLIHLIFVRDFNDSYIVSPEFIPVPCCVFHFFLDFLYFYLHIF